MMQRRSWLPWLVFVLICECFVICRLEAEKQRQANLAQWANGDELEAKLNASEGLAFKEVNVVLCPRQPFPSASVQRTSGFDVVVPGSLIDARYDGWMLRLLFDSQAMFSIAEHGHLLSRRQVNCLGGWHVIPPATLSRVNGSPIWWVLERTRIAGMWFGGMVWFAGTVLIILVRTIRRPAARICLAAALVCMLCAALDLSFDKRAVVHPWNPDRLRILPGDSREVRWQKEIAGHPAWFDASALMVAISLTLSLIPSRQATGNQCPQCLYDLTGNESGICPECGTPTPRARRQQRLAEMEPLADQLVHIALPEELGEWEEDAEPSLALNQSLVGEFELAVDVSDPAE